MTLSGPVQSARTWASINLDSISTKRGFMVPLHGKTLNPPLKPVFDELVSFPW